MSYQSDDHDSILGVWFPVGRDYKYTRDPIEMQEMIVSHPKDHILAYTSDEVIRILHEREGIVPPLCVWKTWYQGNVCQHANNGNPCIDSDAEPGVIAQYLKENSGKSFHVQGDEWHDEWRRHGIAKNRHSKIRYDPKATKSARKYDPEIKQKWREKTGNFSHDSLCRLSSIITWSLEKQIGCQIKTWGGRMRSEELEAGVCTLIDGINRVGVHHALPIDDNSPSYESRHSAKEFTRGIENFVIYVDPPTYKEFQEEGTSRRKLLDFIRSEATRCGFITESNDSESIENAKQ